MQSVLDTLADTDLTLVQCENNGLKISAEGSQVDSHAVKQQLFTIKSDIANVKLQAQKAQEEYVRVMGERKEFETDFNEELLWLKQHINSVTFPRQFDLHNIEQGSIS